MTTPQIFNCKQPLSVCKKLFMSRPNDHFKSNNRLKGLKALLPNARVGTPDIDNLVKFVLDGMNKLVYTDDDS